MRNATHSFGIVVWEIITRETPWRGLQPAKIMMKTLGGKRPPFDEEVYTKLYGKGLLDVMNMCWDHEPKKRPTFMEAMTLLSGKKKSCTFFDEAIRERQKEFERERLRKINERWKKN